MIRDFNLAFKGLIAFFGAALLWSIWVSAQTPGVAVVEFSKALFTVRENARRATVTLNRSGNTNITCTVQVSTEEESATETIDYTRTIEPVTFAAGQIEQRVFIPIKDNFVVDGNRRLKLLLSNPTAGAALGNRSRAELEIEDDDKRQAAWLMFGLDRIKPLQKLIFGVPIWQYIGSLIYVFLAFYLSKLVDVLITGRLRRWAERSKTLWDDVLLDLLRGPLRIIVFVLLLHIGLRIFSWPEWTENYLSKGLIIIVAVSLTYVGIKLVDLATRFWTQRAVDESDRSFNAQLLPIIRNTLKVFVVIVSALLTLQNLGLNITGLIASVSIGGLALSLAAQDTLANFFGALAVLVDKPFRIGDNVKFENVEGTVEAIGFRSTRVRNPEGFLISIPNKTVGNATIINISKRARVRVLFDVGLAYNTTAEKVERALAILNEVCGGHPMTEDVGISFNRFTDSSLNIQVVQWWKSTAGKEQGAGIERMNLAIKQRFDAEGIEFAFPTRTVYLKSDADAPKPETKDG